MFLPVRGLDPGHPVPLAQQGPDRGVRPVARPPFAGGGQQVPGDQGARAKVVDVDGSHGYGCFY